MDSIEKLIYEETEKRLQAMEQPDYKFPETINTADIIGIVVGIAGSITLIVLCMMGVIS